MARLFSRAFDADEMRVESMCFYINSAILGRSVFWFPVLDEIT
jgi:hypothetical protein